MIAENIKILRRIIDQKCLEVNRAPSDITLIAVSKNFGMDEIKAASEEGIIDFGENRAQELVQKFQEARYKYNWHFIGRLQRNKVRYAVECADYIHSVDSLLLISDINRRAKAINKTVKILLQVKTSDEESKTGIDSESEIMDMATYCNEYKNIELVGLMTITALTKDEKAIRESFRYLRSLREQLQSAGLENVKELSMGMTGDFQIAIEEGATMLRIGSAIFGERDHSYNWKEL